MQSSYGNDDNSFYTWNPPKNKDEMTPQLRRKLPPLKLQVDILKQSK